MRRFTPIRTERLVLEKLEICHLEGLHVYRSRDEVRRYQHYDYRNIQDAAGFLEDLASAPDLPGTWFQLALCLKEDGKIIGDMGLHFLEDGAQVEVGYTLDPDFQGKGYATEALTGVLDYLFFDLGKHRVTASLDPENRDSERLLMRTGFRREGLFRKSLLEHGQWVDDLIYGILEEEWFTKRRGRMK